MCVCMFVRVYLCIMCVKVFMYLSVMYLCKYISMYVNMHGRMHVWVYMYVNVFAWPYVCMHE